jgi:HSP20 family protein
MAMNFRNGFSDFVSLRDAMNGLLEDSFVRPHANGASQNRSVPVDIWQTENELVIRVLAPGVRPDQLSISLLNGTLTLKGESEPEPSAAGAHILRQEIAYGSWERSFELPFSVQADKADARFDYGVLTVTLPKADEAKPRQIVINVNTGHAAAGGKPAR